MWKSPTKQVLQGIRQKTTLEDYVIFMWKPKGQAVENREVVHIGGDFVEIFGKPCGNIFNIYLDKILKEGKAERVI